MIDGTNDPLPPPKLPKGMDMDAEILVRNLIGQVRRASYKYDQVDMANLALWRFLDTVN